MNCNDVNVDNVSVHFTTKDQTVDEIKKAWNRFEGSKDYPEAMQVSFHNTQEGSVVHHCFLPIDELIKRNIPTDAVEFVEMEFAENSKCWWEEDRPVEACRKEMIDFVAREKGLCFFIGNIRASGVKQEWDYANSIGVKVHHISI
jgi:hypothetical protein